MNLASADDDDEALSPLLSLKSEYFMKVLALPQCEAFSVPVSKKLESNYVLHLQGNYSDCHVGALI